MILSLLYHHVNSDYLSNSPEMMDKHFKYISEHFETIFPSEYKPSFFGIQVCLVFDDAYYDFYHYVFPLLKKLSIKAIIAVPTDFILDKTDFDSSLRMSIKHSDIMKGENFKKFVPFCTWAELKEMSETGLVKVASHGLKHIRLTEVDENELKNELSVSKKIIESRLNAKCDCFVYPYTAFDETIIRRALEYYDFSFGYGGIMNYKIKNGFLNRVLGDELSNPNELFSIRRILGYYKRTIKSEFLNNN